MHQLYRDIVVLSRSLRKQDILAQFIVRKQDNEAAFTCHHSAERQSGRAVLLSIKPYKCNMIKAFTCVRWRSAERQSARAVGAHLLNKFYFDFTWHVHYTGLM